MEVQHYKPTIFVASSQENLKIAECLKEQVREFAEVVSWQDASAKHGEILFEHIKQLPHIYDFYISIFGPDREINHEQYTHLTSENVVFEFGLFTGTVGTERSFIALPTTDKPKLGADLRGVTYISYSLTDPNDRESVQFSSDDIRQLEDRVQQFRSNITIGSQTTVRIGEDKHLKRRFVEKRFIASNGAERFAQSVLAGMRVSNLPNFAAIYRASLEVKERPYFHMPYFACGSLAGEIRKQITISSTADVNVLPPRPRAIMHWLEVRKYIYKIGKATTSAHSIGHIDVNLKPSNIFLDEKCEPFLTPRVRLDFVGGAEVVNTLHDASKAALNGEDVKLRLEDIVYNAPECFSTNYNHGRDFAQADVYRLGILAFHMLTGRLPSVFYNISPEEENLTAIINHILKVKTSAFADPPHLDGEALGIPDSICRVFEGMTRSRKDERYQTVKDALHELKHVEERIFVHVEESLSRCRKRDDFLLSFYGNFRNAIGPLRMKELFRTDEFADQAKKLDDALEVSVQFIHDYLSQIDFERAQKFSDVARYHAGMKIDGSEYELFSDSLICTICDGDHPFDPECACERKRETIRAEWRLFLGLVVSYFKSESQQYNLQQG
ncbi:nucleotide-binding protein [Ruegeria sp. 2205SS24-7]|uniref:TIR domain-containing protein n=1 Tax=Ruegeria discodermiae TaxID=3064389 RepID=UPI002741DDE5|nr:TIR domain-containing protein [Ruegeria sp. 2205SS24-7]MDP5220235.1 nucleotide-binding protein [Ruegeria sp. 2205SS24-7]